MKKSLRILAVVAVAYCLFPEDPAFAMAITDSGDSSLQGGTVIDFESQAEGVYTSLTIGDVTFTANDNHLHIEDMSYEDIPGVVQSSRFLQNGDWWNHDVDPWVYQEGFYGLTIGFANTVSAFGFDWKAADPGATWILRAYDSSDNLLDTYLLPDSAVSYPAFVGLSSNDISYATLINSTPASVILPAGPENNYDWILIDNLAYKAASVPEPSTMLLLSSGLLGLVGLKRRRKA